MSGPLPSWLTRAVQLPSTCNWHEPDGDLGAWVAVAPDAVRRGRATGLRLPLMKRFVALARWNAWWVAPLFGASMDQLSKEALYLLWQEPDGQYRLLLPLLDDDCAAAVIGGPDGLELRITGELSACDRPVPLALVCGGTDPYRLTHDAVALLSRRLGSFRLRQAKTVPPYADLLGWCTWDAFYQDVTEDGVLAGLKAFKDGGLVPPLLVLDDGWQDATSETDGDQLRSFASHPTKFPSGLAPLIRRAKEEFGVRCFGVWHALQGYWAGLDPNGPLARKYVTRCGHNPLYPDWSKWAAKDRHFVDPSDVHRFFDDWYELLRRQGVDMVKVDSQASHPVFTAGQIPEGPAMRAYQHAVQGAAHVHFGGNYLHCMCHALDIAYNTLSSVMWRNSEDQRPNSPTFHQQHIHMNAMNNLWTGTFGLPDWDIFQSTDPDADFLAAARSISGSPIYVSDKADRHDFALLRKLCTSDGRTLRCPQPAVPTRDCLFVDCHRQPAALKIANRNGPVGVLGLFHCYAPPGTQPNQRPAQMQTIRAQFCAADVPDLDGEHFAAWFHRGGTLQVIGRAQPQSVDLPHLGYELVTLAPIVDGVAPLGLLDKYNGSAALIDWHIDPEGRLFCRLTDGGRVGFYCDRPLKAAYANCQSIGFSQDKSGLVTLSCPTGGPVLVRIDL